MLKIPPQHVAVARIQRCMQRIKDNEEILRIYLKDFIGRRVSWQIRNYTQYGLVHDVVGWGHFLRLRVVNENTGKTVDIDARAIDWELTAQIR